MFNNENDTQNQLSMIKSMISSMILKLDKIEDIYSNEKLIENRQQLLRK